MFKFFKAMLAIAILSISFQITSALAQTARPSQGAACYERATLVKRLGEKYKEYTIAAGLAANGSVLEIFSTADGKSWTVGLTNPNGLTCVMASGESWIEMEKLMPYSGDPS